MQGSSQTPARDLYATVTGCIIQALEQGVRPWVCPWARGVSHTRPLRATGEPYRGVNVLLLWATAQERGYRAPTWMTYRQAEALGGQVRKGERGTLVVYAGQVKPEERQDDIHQAEPGSQRPRSFLRSFTVFNAEQIDGLATAGTPASDVVAELGDQADMLIERTGATVRHGGDRAFYAPALDVVQMPERSRFREAAGYLGTLAHELVHWTGHANRLARTFGTRFGDEAYAVEELVAELGSAFLCADLQISTEPRDDHAGYLAHWLSVLKADKRALFTVAAQAQRAADFIMNREQVA